MKYISQMVRRYQKIIGWGAGDFFNRYCGLLEGKIAYVADNNNSKQGQRQQGIEIVPPDRLLEENPSQCLIVVFSSSVDSIVSQILNYGPFSIIDIITFYSLLIREKETDKIGIGRMTGLPVVVCGGMHAVWDTNGSRKFIDDQLDLIQKAGLQTIEIVPLRYYENGKGCRYIWADFNNMWNDVFLITEFADLYPVVWGFIIHSLYYDHQVLDDLLSRVRVKRSILYYAHDYYCICKNRFLYNERKNCVLDDGSLDCRSCECGGIQKEHMLFHKNLFQKYGINIITPSEDTKRRIEKAISYNKIAAVGHLTYKTKICPKTIGGHIKIAYIGGANRLKGWEQFKQIVEKFKDQYIFYCIGHCEEAMKVDNVNYVNVGLKHTEHTLTMVEALLEYQIDLVFLGSIWPETYSYTYFEAFEAGCFVLTNNLSGNICDQVLKNENGLVFSDLKQLSAFLEDHVRVLKYAGGSVKEIYDVRANDQFLEYLT